VAFAINGFAISTVLHHGRGTHGQAGAGGPAAGGPRILDFGEWLRYRAQNGEGKAKMQRLGIMALALWLMVAAPLGAQGNRAGEFDHYLLALTWMPSFCALEGDGRDDPRCAPGRRAGWMLHGLWPQHPGGAWPEYCQTPHRAPSRMQTAAQAWLFGTSGAAWHQWNKHGRCTGLPAQDYFALSARAMEQLTLPPVFEAVERGLRIDPAVIEAAFLEANPTLAPDMMLTTCRGRMVYELRLCLSRDLAPRPCDAATFARECALDQAELPALR
jgi:ribonuclease T2